MIMFTISPFKLFPLFEIRDPDLEKMPSQGTVVAGGHKYFFASV
jgi:hypothetical protein